MIINRLGNVAIALGTISFMLLGAYHILFMN